MERDEVSPSLGQAQRLKQLSGEGKLENNIIDLIMREEKPLERKVTIRNDRLQKYFPSSYTPKQMEGCHYQSCWKAGTASGNRSRRDEERTDAQERATGNLFFHSAVQRAAIIIRCGERGYYPSEWDTGNREENREIASSHNVRRGITDIQEAAMLAGSMFGWNTPGANPQWYLDNARYVNSNIVQGHIKDPIMSVYYPVSSFLLCYEDHGQTALLSAHGQTAARADGPKVAVHHAAGSGAWSTGHAGDSDLCKNRSCTIQLEHGSYVVGKWSIRNTTSPLAFASAGAEFVMGECESPPPSSHGSATVKRQGTAHPISFGALPL